MPHPLVHLSGAHGKHVETSLPTNNVYLQPAAMECHCLDFPFSWMTTLKETVRLWSASWQERKHGGLRNINPNKSRMELPPSSTRYPQQNKRHIFFPQVEGFLDQFEKKRNIYKWCHNPLLSKNVVKMWGVAEWCHFPKVKSFYLTLTESEQLRLKTPITKMFVPWEWL